MKNSWGFLFYNHNHAELKDFVAACLPVACLRLARFPQPGPNMVTVPSEADAARVREAAGRYALRVRVGEYISAGQIEIGYNPTATADQQLQLFGEVGQ